MAKTKAAVNKSEEIRKVFADSPGAMAKEVVATLKEQGITISDALVYAVKKKLKPGKKRAPAAKRHRKPSPPLPTAGWASGLRLEWQEHAAEKVGGLKALKEIVDALQ